MAANVTGSWSALIGWPLIGIHASITADGKVLTFGTDPYGKQGATMYHALWDPATGVNELINHTMTTPTDIFCATSVAIPGTDSILISGGDARPLGHPNRGVADVNMFNASTYEVTQVESMTYARWYASSFSLPTGQVLVMGGLDANLNGIPYPEIYTPGQGWKVLTGALDWDVAAGYPRAFVNNQGKVVYFSTEKGPNAGYEVMLLDTTGTGSIRKIGELPFTYENVSPTIQYAPGKILINDATTGLWSMDINGPTPTFEKVGTLAQDRNFSNMTVMADGKVLITGGTGVNNLEAYAEKTAVMWDPVTKTTTEMPDEANPRLYHSTALLLPDGSILSLGGGSAGGAEHNYMDGQIYKPPYLFDATGAEAKRPVVTTAPDHVAGGSTFTITVDNAADIGRMTLVKGNSVTHDYTSDSGAAELKFTIVDEHVISVTMPDYHGGVSAGIWMLFAWNKAGVPAVAPIIQVDPVPLNLVFNGDFENQQFVSGQGWAPFNNSNLDGWKNLNANYMELVNYTGSQALELDGILDLDAVYQDIKTELGKSYTLHFDVTRVVPGTSDFEVLWNGQVIATVKPTTAQGYDFTVVGTGAADRLMFRELASQNNGTGAAIDNISLKAPPQLAPDTPVTFANVIVNGDFEAQKVTSGEGWQAFDNTNLTGWKNLNANYMELVNYTGSQALEIDGVADLDAIYQDIKTTAGQKYVLHFDVTRVIDGTSSFEVLWNGQVISLVEPKGPGSYDFSVTGTGGNDRLMFRELASQNNGTGAAIDNIALRYPVDNLVVNGDLEAQRVTSGQGWQAFDNTNLTGWKNLNANYIELVNFTGSQGIDLDGVGDLDAIYQDVKTEPGKHYTLRFDVTKVAAGSSDFDVLWNGNVIATVKPTQAQSYEFTVTGTGGSDRLMFREYANQNNGTGAVIDNVSMKATALPPAYDNLLVNGDLEAPAAKAPVYQEAGIFAAYDNAGVPGWKNAAQNYLEIVQVGGTKTIDTDAGLAADAIYQTVTTKAGMTYKLHFDVLRATTGTADFDVLWNDKVVATVTPGSAAGYDFTVVGTGGADKLTFREVASQNDGRGALLDNLSLKADPMAGMNHGVPNLLVNSDLETGKMTATTPVQAYDNTGIPGWKNESANATELQKVGTTQGLETDVGTAVDSIYQGVKTEAGKTYDLHFDVIKFTAGTSAFEVLWNGSVVSTVDPAANAGHDFKVVGTGGVDKLAFRELSSQNNGTGAVLDNITLKEGAPAVGNLIVNGGFEAASTAAPVYEEAGIFAGYDNSGVSGWKNAGQNYLEIVQTGNTKTLDVDAGLAADAIYQTVTTTAGTTYKLHFDVVSAQAGTSDFDVLWNDKVVATINPTSATGYDLSVVGTGGADKLTFRESVSQNDGHGALLDNVSLQVQAPPAAGDLIVNGNFNAAAVAPAVYQEAGIFTAYDNSGVSGWKNAGQSYIEIVEVGGAKAIDLDAGLAADAMYQTITTTAGTAYTLHFDVVGAAAGTSDFDVLWNDKVIATVNPTGAADYDFNVVGTGGVDKLTFREAASQNDGTGALVNNVSLQSTATAPHTSLLSNGSFETTTATLSDGPSWKLVGTTEVTGWTGANSVEVWHDGYNGQAGTDGRNVVEIDAGNGLLSQMVHTTAGSVYGLSFDLAGRAGNIASSKVDVVWNGQIVSTITPTDATFHNYHINLTGTGHDTLTFQSTAGDTDGAGGLLDNVILHDHAIAV